MYAIKISHPGFLSGMLRGDLTPEQYNGATMTLFASEERPFTRFSERGAAETVAASWAAKWAEKHWRFTVLHEVPTTKWVPVDPA